MINYLGIIEDRLRKHLDGQSESAVDTIHTRSNGRGGLSRIYLDNGKTVVVKLWYARNAKEKIKALVRLSNGCREWRMHRIIHQAGVDVPRPLAFHRFNMNDVEICEVMVLEDLGETENGMVHFKRLISQGNEAVIMAFEDLLIDKTIRLLNLHILDIDHQMNNFVVDKNKRLLRIDFECARRYPFHLKPRKLYVEMVARFITGHIHAVQPDVSRSVSFAERLYARLDLGKNIKYRISEAVKDNLAYQFEQSELDIKITLPT